MCKVLTTYNNVLSTLPMPATATTMQQPSRALNSCTCTHPSILAHAPPPADLVAVDLDEPEVDAALQLLLHGGQLCGVQRHLLRDLSQAEIGALQRQGPNVGLHVEHQQRLVSLVEGKVAAGKLKGKASD
jgi:hypothetical protein